MLAERPESVSLLMIAARNVKKLIFQNLLGDQELLEIAPLLQSNTNLERLDIEYFFLLKTYTFKSLCEFLNQDHN